MIRVLPRDAFNDANLLKCIGKITLLIEDGYLPWLTFQHDGAPFSIIQDESDGSTFVENVIFFLNQNRVVRFSRPLNSKGSWPLEMEYGGEIYEVFDESGTVILDPETFTEACDLVKRFLKEHGRYSDGG